LTVRTLIGRIVMALLVAGLPAAVAGPVLAHHSYSIYDSTKPMTLNGTIVDVSFQNPHVYVSVNAGDKVWRLDMPGPGRMRSRGLTPEVLAVGRTLEVLGWPHRRGNADFAPVSMTIDGKTFEIRRNGGR
jgi:hypothetical protein